MLHGQILETVILYVDWFVLNKEYVLDVTETEHKL